MTHSQNLARGAAAFLLLVGAGRASAQADFYEGFESLGGNNGRHGPQSLIDKGWIFSNQSEGRGTTVWYHGTNEVYPYFYPREGRGYLASKSSWDSGNRRISTWAVLPPIPGQRQGDLVAIYLASASGPSDRFQLRYSPGGGVSTGTDWDDVGDFTEVLLDVEFPGLDGNQNAPWDQVSVATPGPGRLAIRWFNEQMDAFQSPVVGLDWLTVGPAPCNQPPAPAPGETVVWRAADSPYRVCDTISIPPTGTVVVEPGVAVEFDQGTQLLVGGTLTIDATEAEHARFSYPSVYPPMVEVLDGTVDGAFAEFEGQMRIGSGATVRLEGCEFRGDGLIWMQGIYQSTPHVALTGCLFEDTFALFTDAVIELRGNSFVRGHCSVLRGYPVLSDANTFTGGGSMSITREEMIQPLYVDAVHATGALGPAGLRLEGGHFLVGPGVVLQDNVYPIRLVGGLMPGSNIPLTGNSINVIDVADAGMIGPGRWPDLGLPYRITEVGSGEGGDLKIEPGVVVEGVAGALIVAQSGRRLIADGTPESPITFRAVHPSQRWQGLVYHVNSAAGPRLEYCVIEDALFGAISTDNHLYVDNCVFRANAVGANCNTYGSIAFRKTQFIANETGVSMSDLGTPLLLSFTNPNSFEGNAAAIDAFEFGSAAEANLVWWGHPSGPLHPQNPGGQGDPIVGPGASGVSIFPFLDARPDFTDTPPVVRMREPGFGDRAGGRSVDYLLEQGAKYMLYWDARDDGGIVSQRIEFSPDGHYNGRYEVLVDGIPADARSWEITVPDPGFAGTYQPQFLRVVAVDTAGQEAWDQVPLTVPSGRLVGEIDITSDFSGQTFYGGEKFPDMFWTGTVDGFPSIDPFIILESDGHAIEGLDLGGRGWFFSDIPHISTDTARLAVRARNNSNDILWFFADHYFSIRHDPRLGLVPPQVAMTSPPDGASFAGGGMAPIRWTASDDEALHSFDIQVSYDGGRTFHMLAMELPPQTREYDWRLAPSGGIPDVRLRVIARDIRFQNSSDGAERSIAILPGDGCASDFNGDGGVDTQDVLAFLNAWAAQDGRADFNGDGIINTQDVLAFLNAWTTGC